MVFDDVISGIISYKKLNQITELFIRSRKYTFLSFFAQS